MSKLNDAKIDYSVIVPVYNEEIKSYLYTVN